MHTRAELVVGSDGYCAVFLDRERALQWAARCGGLIDDLVSRWEAEQAEKEAFRRGLVEGQSLAGIAQCPPAVCESPAASDQTSL